MYSSYLSFYIYSLHFLKHGTFRSRFLIGAYQFSALTVRRQIYLERDKIRLWHTDAQFGKGELLFCLRATLRRDLYRTHVLVATFTAAVDYDGRMCACVLTRYCRRAFTLLLLQRHRLLSGRCLYCFCFVG